jgi:phosphatidylinositol alpha-mannosyltransferase
MRRVIGRLDGKIVVSEACIGSLAPYLPYAYTVIPNGIDDRHFSPEADPIAELCDGKLNILFLGRFDPRNGLDTMIGAFTEVRRRVGPDVRLIVVGDGPLKSRYQSQVPADVAPDVHWAGRVNWNRPRYYATADIHCTPCQRASFGMVLLEAMSCGRPVVASRISGFQLLMEHGKQGLLISPAESVERFADALMYMIEHPEERDRMGREGRKTAVTEYAWTKVAEQLEDYYVDLLDKGPRP